MKTVGIIAEYNPFHNGHLYQMLEARKQSGADYLVVVMSPDFVQRGEPALLDKWTRARMALDGGADLVLELPVRYATGSAEFFASGAISVLSGLGVVDSLSFGCEMNQSSGLSHTAGTLFEYAKFLSEDEPEEYSAMLKKNLKNGMSYAQARCLAYLSYTGRDDENALLNSPNNILAVEYMKAILRSGAGMSVLPILRIGAGYNDKKIQKALNSDRTGMPSGTMFASATGIRSALDAGSDIRNLMPPTALKLLMDEISLHRFLVPADLDLPLHLALYEKRSSLTDYVDVSEDLANRIEHLLPQYLGFDQFTALLKTRQIAYTRVRRALLHILLGLKKDHSKISCARVLGFRKDSSALLHEIKKKASIPLITKLPSEARLGHSMPKDFNLDQPLQTNYSSTRPLPDEENHLSFDQSLTEEDLNATQLWELIVSHKTGAPVRNERQRQILIGS